MFFYYISFIYYSTELQDYNEIYLKSYKNGIIKFTDDIFKAKRYASHGHAINLLNRFKKFFNDTYIDIQLNKFLFPFS